MKREVKIKSFYEYDPEEFTGEVNTLPSEVIPDESLTIRDILVRFTSGVGYAPGSVFGELHEDGDVSIDDNSSPWNDPDITLSDLMDMHESLSSRIKDLQEKVKEDIQSEREKAIIAKYEAEKAKAEEVNLESENSVLAKLKKLAGEKE